ncbi:DUF3164 family protein [Pedobacter sp.]|uniref:DUF3164 family protein n=1 Tax=Pedobacter sp. TaxID=1411316 RepID=UPI00396CE793
MKTLTLNVQTSKNKMWKDEAGIEIPYSRTTPFERKCEKTVGRVATRAMKINSDMTAFKNDLKREVEVLYEDFKKENGGIVGKGKGNATFYSFDRSIKVEVSINEAITFDENCINLAHEMLKEVISEGLSGAADWIEGIVLDAFAKSNGKLDTKKVLGLRKYEQKVNKPRYSEAMRMIDKGIMRPSSKEYFRVWVKDGNGEYIDVQLNFSAIKID